MSISKSLVFLTLAALLISSAMAQSPAPAPSIRGGRRISPSPTPKPSSVATSPPTPSQAVSPSTGSTTALSPSSSISGSPAQAPGPASGAVSNSYALFGGSLAVILYAAVLAI